jgi:hypothetical protein
VFPSGYWDMSPPSEIRIADFSVSVGVGLSSECQR